MAKETLLQKYERELINKRLPLLSQEARQWLMKKGANMKQSTAEGIRNNLLNGDPLGKAPRRFPGHVFLYQYDAKHADTLPYWDKYPLIIHMGPWVDSSGFAKGWAGLNLHYLPPSLRAKLFDALLTLISDKTMTDDTKFKLSWRILKNSTKYELFKPCYKHYLWNHRKSPMVHIPAYEWEKILFLPLASWQNSSSTQVWADSKRIIAGKK